MEQLAHRPAAPRPAPRPAHQSPQRAARRSASARSQRQSVQVGGEVQAVHGAHCRRWRRHRWASRVRAGAACKIRGFPSTDPCSPAPLPIPGACRRIDIAPADGQRHPRAVHGRRAAGQLRPSRRADGHGRHRRGAVGPPPAPQPGQPALGRPRPLRAVERPRLDAAVCAAAPDRLRPADRGAAATSASCTARRRATPKSASRPASRPPPARSARAWPTRSAWRWPRSCSPREFNRAGHDDRRPPHLCLHAATAA